MKTVQLNRKTPPSVASILVEYAYDYNRETDMLDTPASGTGDCVEQTCTAAIEAEAGRVLYYRLSDRDANGTVVRRGIVHTAVIR